MIERIAYDEINARAVGGFAALRKHISKVDKKLAVLLELRVSQINGCVYCLDLHARQARELGEQQQRLDCIAAWDECPFFEEHEKAAFAWAEAITNVSQTHASDAVYQRLQTYFSDEEIVDLTLVVTFMNAWNRLAIGFLQLPEKA
ncbi:MAG: carboxymuconolactone decarboxylase family protein [Arenicella sp.]